jgi:hypothetical protein
MEIDITDFITGTDTWEFSGSIATHGQDAARNTWSNAMREAGNNLLLTTDEQLQALRDHVEGMGFGAEVQAYDTVQCNALFIQLIAGHMRECGMDEIDLDEFDWDAYQQQVEHGNISGNIYRGDVEGSPGYGRIFYYLGS